MDIDKIGKFIKELRTDKGLSQNQLGEEIHVTRQAISNWENGKALPDSDLLRKLSELFNVSIDELLSGERIKDEKHLEETTLSLLDDNIKKRSTIKRITTISILSIISIIGLFLLYYFVTNYNSIKVYYITGENEHYLIHDGLMTSTRNRNYLKLEIPEEKIDLEDIKKIRIYYLNAKKKEINLYSIKELEKIVFKFSLKNNSDLNQLLNNLYMEIKREDEIETIKLKCSEDFKNDFYNQSSRKDNKTTAVSQIVENIIEPQEEQEIVSEPAEEKVEIIEERREEPNVVEEQKPSGTNYLEIKSIIEEKGADQFGKKLVEFLLDSKYVNVSTQQNMLYVDVLDGNIIKSWQYDIISSSLFYQKYENYIEVSNIKFDEQKETDEYRLLKENMNQYLTQLY